MRPMRVENGNENMIDPIGVTDQGPMSVTYEYTNAVQAGSVYLHRIAPAPFFSLSFPSPCLVFSSICQYEFILTVLALVIVTERS
jgi:hypothetical protein